jgi:hypothetical protein
LHDPEKEPTADSTFDFKLDKESLSKEKLRNMIYEQSLHFHEGEE